MFLVCVNAKNDYKGLTGGGFFFYYGENGRKLSDPFDEMKGIKRVCQGTYSILVYSTGHA